MAGRKLEKVVHDPELQAVLARAKKLRIPMAELARECGETSVNLWRWEYQSAPPWDRRRRFLEKAHEYLEACKKEYLEA